MPPSGQYECPHCGERISLPKLPSVVFGLVMQTLKENGFNRTRTADILGVSARSIRYWIEKYRKLGMEIPNSDRAPVPIDTSWADDPTAPE